MESKTAEGLTILFFIIFLLIGSWILGLKFWFWICVAGGIAIAGMILIWFLNVILGIGSLAKRQ